MTTDLRTRDPGPELPGLVETLERAADQHFDVGSVRAGIDGRVLHARRQRRGLTAVAASVAVVGVVGATTWLLAPGRDLGQVAQPPPPVTAAPAPSGDVTPTTVPAPRPSTSATTTTATVLAVPEAAMLTPEQVGGGRQITFDSGEYANQPVASGQLCDSAATGATGPAPVVGRQRTWSASPTDFDGQVDVVVTGWQAGTGQKAFAAVVEDSGRCVWLDPVTEVAAPGWQGDEGYLVATAPVSGSARAIAVQRVGDLLVGATAYDRDGDAAAQAEAQRVSDLVVEALVASGLPGTGR